MAEPTSSRPMSWAGPLDPAGMPYPPSIRTEERMERWDICTRVALAVWEKMAPPGTPLDWAWLIYTVREYYSSDIATGTPDDAPIPAGQRRSMELTVESLVETGMGREQAEDMLSGAPRPPASRPDRQRGA